MIPPLHRVLLPALLCCACAACESLKPEKVPRATPIRFPKADAADAAKAPRKQVGTILMVNGDGGFVLIDARPGSMPEAGVALKCMREGAETGIIAVGKERQGTHVAADIVTGSPGKGDQVFR